MLLEELRNKVFALETNLATVRHRMEVICADTPTGQIEPDTVEVFESMTNSLEQMKELLHEEDL